MANESISQYSSILAVPPPLKLATRFANGIDEAEQATLSKPPFKETTIRGILEDKRTLSNATTLIGKELGSEELSPTNTRLSDDNGIDGRKLLLKYSVLIVPARSLI